MRSFSEHTTQVPWGEGVYKPRVTGQHSSFGELAYAREDENSQSRTEELLSRRNMRGVDVLVA